MKISVDYTTPMLQSDIKFKKKIILWDLLFSNRLIYIYISVLLKSVTYRIVIASGGSIVKLKKNQIYTILSAKIVTKAELN